MESKLEYPINLKLDLHNYRLYWLDYKLKKIDSISIANRHHQVLQLDRYSVYRFDENFQPKQFDLFDDFLYIIGSSTLQKPNKLYIIHKFNKSILRDDVLDGNLRVFDYTEFKPESIEFSTKLSHIFILNPLKQPNETFIYMSKFFLEANY